MAERVSKQILFSPEAIDLLNDIQNHFNLKDHEAVIKEGIKLLAVARKWPLYIMADGLLTEVEIGEDRNADDIKERENG